jgi:hypothetical protein
MELLKSLLGLVDALVVFCVKLRLDYKIQ